MEPQVSTNYTKELGNIRWKDTYVHLCPKFLSKTGAYYSTMTKQKKGRGNDLGRVEDGGDDGSEGRSGSAEM
jgi:hypothetical protein